MSRLARAIAPLCLVAFAAAAPGRAAAANKAEGAPDPASLDFFEARVRPVLVGHCAACHSAETKPAGGLRVDDRKGLTDGGDNGPAIVPGDPAAGLLLARITHADPRRRMPKEGAALTDAQVSDLRAWIAAGAAWPKPKASDSLLKDKAGYEELRRTHWAWQPLAEPAVPSVSDPSWAADDLDRFVLAKLDAAGLRPVADASPEALLRRLTFDLTGLPPTPEELDAFRADNAPDALGRLVDRLLASPRFGERWGRHWLDVARYGESTGPSRNIPYPHAWRYRDYIIDAVNDDVPFDRFVAEQVAGDLLPASTDADRDRLKIATGFLALGVKDVNQRFKVRFEMDNVDDQIDAVGRAVLGLTVSCARCHDHKFDPIPQRDYYALAGIFTSTVNAAGVRNKMGGGGLDYYDPAALVGLSGMPPEPPEEARRALEARVAEAKKAWDGIRGTREGLAKGPDGRPVQRKFREAYEKLNGELLALTDPAAHGLAVHGVRDAAKVADTEIRLRGEAERLGPVVPRGFLSAFDVPGAPAVDRSGSGRRELAAWLTAEANPLTPRVFVNRVWAHLMGRGIVSTVDNFGLNGDDPTHPELLDHLARRFVRDGQSLKRLVRAIVLSRTYRLSTEATAKHRLADPGNTLYWRHAPRRLDAEEVRDAMLAAAGVLDTQRPKGSPAQALRMVEMRDNGPEAKRLHEAADASTVRSVYLPLLRGVIPRPLAPFDPVEQTLVTGRRDATTGPAQALFLLNSAFVRRQSLAAADRAVAAGSDESDQVRALYRVVLGREPREPEVRRAVAFVSEFASAGASWAVASAEPATVTTTAATAAPRAEVIDPDQADQSTVPIVEADAAPRDARSAAWLALAQALFATAEFRYAP